MARAVPLGEPRAAAGGEGAEDHSSCRDERHLDLLLLLQAAPVALQLVQLLPQPPSILAALFEHLLYRLAKGCDAPLHSPQQRLQLPRLSPSLQVRDSGNSGLDPVGGVDPLQAWGGLVGHTHHHHRDVGVGVGKSLGDDAHGFV